MNIIFDIGGVTVHGTSKEVHELVARRFGISIDNFSTVRAQWADDALTGRISDERFIERMGLAFSIDPAEMRKAWEDSFSAAMRINEEVVLIIEELREKGHRTPLITNTTFLHAELNRSRHLYDLFNPALLSCECGVKKPDPAIYLKMIGLLQCDPQDCVLIDDKEENLVPAAALGMRTIHFHDAVQLRTELAKVGIL